MTYITSSKIYLTAERWYSAVGQEVLAIIIGVATFATGLMAMFRVF